MITLSGILCICFLYGQCGPFARSTFVSKLKCSVCCSPCQRLLTLIWLSRENLIDVFAIPKTQHIESRFHSISIYWALKVLILTRECMLPYLKAFFNRRNLHWAWPYSLTGANRALLLLSYSLSSIDELLLETLAIFCAQVFPKFITPTNYQSL